MIVTLNEVQRACQKALFGAGVPAGLDDDAADATVWLEACGIPALASLVDVLERWTGDSSAISVAETAPGTFDTGGRSAVLVGSSLIDLAIARANSNGTGCLKVSGLKDPRFLVPWAANYAEDEWGLQLTWNRQAASVHSIGGVTLFGDWAAPAEGPCDVTIECRYSWSGGFDVPLSVAHSNADLEARYDQTLSTGLAVDDEVWQTIARHACRTLVPASADSRARGAGSAASDNE